MRKLRIYVDTSVFGGTQDDEFAAPTGRFLDRVERGAHVLLVSDVVYRELEDAPDEVKQVVRSLSPGGLVEVPVDEEVERLKEAYIAAGVLGRSSEDDARHVAAATVAGADLIVSWNDTTIQSRRRENEALRLLMESLRD